MADELFLYGEVGLDIEAEPFVQVLRARPTQDIALRIHSPGGSVFDASTMYHAIKDHKGRVTAYVDGVAASAASFLAMAAGEIIVGEQAFMMVHQPWSMAVGTAADLRRDAEKLDKVGQTMAAAYAGRVGDELAASWFSEGEHWFNAAESVEVGLADAIGTGGKAYACFDLSAKFKAVPAKAKQLYGEQPKPLTIRGLERRLREAGMSRKAAAAAAAASWRALHGDHAAAMPDAELADLCAYIKQKSSSFKEMLHGNQRYQSGH